jgi:hypothetical protein
VAAKRVQSLEHCLSATSGIKASPAPNLQNRKSLNFQGKIKRKSKVSKLSDVENVETVEAAEATNGYKEMEAVTLDQHIGVRIPRGKQFFQLSAVKIRGSHSFRDAEIPGSLNRIIESKKSAEWWNVINDKNHEWTDSPNHQKS